MVMNWLAIYTDYLLQSNGWNAANVASKFVKSILMLLKPFSGLVLARLDVNLRDLCESV